MRLPRIPGFDRSLWSEAQQRYVLLFLSKRLQMVVFYQLLTSIVLYTGGVSGFIILWSPVAVSTSVRSAFGMVLGKNRFSCCFVDTHRITAIERFSPRTKPRLLSPPWNTSLWYEVYGDVSILFVRAVFGKNCRKDCRVIAVSTTNVHLLYL
jgi:hypothetical protein